MFRSLLALGQANISSLASEVRRPAGRSWRQLRLPLVHCLFGMVFRTRLTRFFVDNEKSSCLDRFSHNPHPDRPFAANSIIKYTSIDHCATSYLAKRHLAENWTHTPTVPTIQSKNDGWVRAIESNATLVATIDAPNRLSHTRTCGRTQVCDGEHRWRL